VSNALRPYDPDREFPMPASMRERLPQGHLACFVSDVVEQLNLSAIMKRYRGEIGAIPLTTRE